MTEVTFHTDKYGELLGFSVYGHSGFAEEGEDIVCAAVSSAVTMAVNTVTDIMHIDADVDVREADLSFSVSRKYAKDCRDILNGLKLHLISLEEQYQDYITVKYTEV